MFSQIFVASQSAIKLEAVKAVVASANAPVPTTSTSSSSSSSSERRSAFAGLFTTDCAIESMKPVDTGCPQPVGEQSARACIARRFSAIQEGVPEKTLLVGIENYIHCQDVGHAWYDRCLVVLVYNGGSVCEEAMVDIEVPEKFEPKSAPDIVASPVLGFCETIGARFHAAFPHVPSDDWFRAASSTNPTRFDVVCDAFGRALQHIVLQSKVAPLLRVTTTDTNENLVSFLAAKSGAMTLSQCLVNQVNAFVGPVRLERNDSLGAPNFVAERNWRDEYFVYGLEGQGSLVGGILATRLGTPFMTSETPSDLVAPTMRSLPNNCIVVDYRIGNGRVAHCQNLARFGKRIVLFLAMVGDSSTEHLRTVEALQRCIQAQNPAAQVAFALSLF